MTEVVGRDWTVERGLEGTAPSPHLIESKIEHKLTAGMWNGVQDQLNGRSVTLGEGANVPADDFDSVTIGRDSHTEIASVALGREAKAESQTVAIGYLSNGLDSSVAVGRRTETGRWGTALGPDAKATGDFSVALGDSTEATGRMSVAIGAGASAKNDMVGTFGSVPTPLTWAFAGDLFASGTKNFEIPHPYPDKKATHMLRHAAVESPTEGDNLYRFTVEAAEDGETVELQLPDYFPYLNKNVDVYVSPDRHFGRAYGEVIDGKLLVTCESAGKYKALVIGTRNDDNVQNWGIKGVEREVGESWTGETYVFEVPEITEIEEIREVE